MIEPQSPHQLFPNLLFQIVRYRPLSKPLHFDLYVKLPSHESTALMYIVTSPFAHTCDFCNGPALLVEEDRPKVLRQKHRVRSKDLSNRIGTERVVGVFRHRLYELYPSRAIGV